ncbi:uncharacterized protein LOC103574478 isoform X2 [Microplitis demolitor]|uniref:uncharacterized protein LOC103574478 isoform X2 n=1 Tax=Microplitis demolitor TaxID=69319 RepID=UPI0006D5203B|nr:uncharacterized protein LOC103574478 isoform X2 [Microplitis demolitor]
MGTLETINKNTTRKLREEFLYYVLQWDPKWFTESDESTIQLNSIVPLKLKQLSLLYDNYDDYYQAQLSSLLYDFWYQLYDISLRGDKCEKASDITLSKTSLPLRCISVNSENDKVCRVKMRTVVPYSLNVMYANRGCLAKFKNSLNENAEEFACVDNVLFDKIHWQPKYQLTYDLIIKYQENMEIPNSIILESVSPMLSVYINFIDSLINIAKTPLCEAILRPNIKDYEFSSISDNDKIEPLIEDKLNSKQLDIIARTVKTVEEKKPGIFMISGAAGTGKSKIIVESVLAMLIKKKKGVRLNIIRIGREDKINEQVKPIYFKRLKKNLRDEHASMLLENANVIAGTLSTSPNLYMKRFFKNMQIPVCIIDEAPQAIEIETCNPLMLGVRILILVGDSQQFCPKVYSEEALDNNLGQSLFWRAQKIFEKEKKSPIMTLEDQYRMTDAIAEWPNKFFYKGTLKNCVSVRPLGFYNYRVLNHSSPEEEGGYVNIGEAKLVVNIAYTVMTQAKLENLRSKIDIGIIAFSDLQRDLIIEMLDERTSDICDDRKDKFQLTVVKMGDAFQGSACDIIILSCVRSLEPKFIDDPNRLCVSLTRAKHTLIICGNFAEYNQNAMWDSLIKDAQKRNSYFTINYNDESSTLKQYQISDN